MSFRLVPRIASGMRVCTFIFFLSDALHCRQLATHDTKTMKKLYIFAIDITIRIKHCRLLNKDKNGINAPHKAMRMCACFLFYFVALCTHDSLFFVCSAYASAGRKTIAAHTHIRFS